MLPLFNSLLFAPVDTPSSGGTMGSQDILSELLKDDDTPEIIELENPKPPKSEEKDNEDEDKDIDKEKKSEKDDEKDEENEDEETEEGEEDDLKELEEELEGPPG